MALLELQQVSYIYPNGSKALDQVSMSFEEGEKVAIIGQNGAGKTTAVKLMNGLLKPTSGTVIVDGWNTLEHTTAQVSSKVGYVFQNPDDQIFHEKIREEVEFSTRHLNLSESEASKVVNEALQLTGLMDVADLHPYSLPYSLRKFVAIAAVLSMQTKVVILDEPTAGQDARSLERLTKIIEHLTKNGKTVIMITHDMNYVADQFDRVIAMANRRVVSDSTAKEIFWNPAVMKESHLQAPPVTQLAGTQSLGERIITVDAFVKACKGTKE